MTSRKRSGLGKGLNAIIADATIESGTSGQSNSEVDIKLIHPNPNQPRKNFDEEQLDQLADSIKNEGLLQPILVRKDDEGYEIVAGERRWQACKKAGLEKVSSIVVDMDDEQMLRVALIENLQRTDLNAIEEARGYRDLMKMGGLTQSELAEAVSKSRSAIANTLRLLDLPEEVQQLVYDGKLSAGHARAVLSIPGDDKRIELANKIVDEKLSVREAERVAALYASGQQERPKKAPAPRSYKLVAKELKKKLGTSVKVKTSGGKNKIEIEFKDEDDLQRIYEMIK